MEKSESVQLEMFIDQAKEYLLKSFKKETSTGDLTRIYPIEVHSYSSEKHAYSFDVKPLDYLGNLYEKLLPQKIKKDFGTFYTRDNIIVNSMLDGINLFECKILEPSHN